MTSVQRRFSTRRSRRPYTFPLGGFEAHAQGALAYQGSRNPSLRVLYNDILGDIPSTTFLDLAFGIENDKYAVELFVENATEEDAPLDFDVECATDVCGTQAYGVSHEAAEGRDPVQAGLLRPAGLVIEGAPQGAPFLFRRSNPGTMPCAG